MAAELGNKDGLLVADAGGRDVLVAVGELLHGIHMHAAFVREGRAPDEGGAGEMGVIGNVVHEP